MDTLMQLAKKEVEVQDLYRENVRRLRLRVCHQSSVVTKVESRKPIQVPGDRDGEHPPTEHGF